MQKPLVAITLGDPAGVGPETIVGSWSSPALHDACRPFAVGHPEFLCRAVKLLGLNIQVQEITSPEELEACHAIRAILRGQVSPKRLVMRDAQSYCATVRTARIL